MSMGASGSTGSANSVSRENGLRMGSATDEEKKWSWIPRDPLLILKSKQKLTKTGISVECLISLLFDQGFTKNNLDCLQRVVGEWIGWTLINKSDEIGGYLVLTTLAYLIGRVAECQTLVGGGDVHGKGTRVSVHTNLEDRYLQYNNTNYTRVSLSIVIFLMWCITCTGG